MHIFKFLLYALTAGGMFFFGFRQMRLRNELTDDVLRGPGSGQIAESFKRQRILDSLPPELLVPCNRAAALKFGFFALLVIEVVLLQR
ncbi:MAG TPA: hypothetical protein VN612_06035 [Acidobacteriaceae bacterium]|nr:hypothetical protein [Acidobacteriaceae bacterium]